MRFHFFVFFFPSTSPLFSLLFLRIRFRFRFFLLGVLLSLVVYVFCLAHFPSFSLDIISRWVLLSIAALCIILRKFSGTRERLLLSILYALNSPGPYLEIYLSLPLFLSRLRPKSTWCSGEAVEYADGWAVAFGFEIDGNGRRINNRKAISVSIWSFALFASFATQSSGLGDFWLEAENSRLEHLLPHYSFSLLCLSHYLLNFSFGFLSALHH